MTEFQKLQTQALRYLSVRARSKKEVVDYFVKKNADPTTAAEVIAKLERLKLIDDVAFAKWYVESRSRSKPRSAWLLARELHQKGIDKSAVTDISSESEEDLATRALTKRLARYANLPWQVYRERAGRFLASRGFQAGVIEKILKKTYNGQDVTEEF